MIEKEIDFRDYILLFLKYKYIVAGILLVCLSIGFLFYKLEVPFYSSTATLILDTESLDTKYTVTNVQNIDTIREVAYSYETILQAVVDLDLVNVDVEPEIIDKLKDKATGMAPFIKKEPKVKDIRETVQYYRDRISVGTARGGLMKVTAITQDPKLSQMLANKIAEIIVAKNKAEKDKKITNTIAYIDNQLKSIKDILEDDIKRQQEVEGNPDYIQLIALTDRVENDKQLLSLLKREKEHLNTMEVLTYQITEDDFDDPNLDADEKEALKQRQKQLESQRNQIMLQKNYVEARINETMDSLEISQEIYREMDKEPSYAAKEIDFSIESNQKIYSTLLGEKQSIVLAELISANDIRIFSKAWEPLSSDKTKGLVYLIVFALAGGAISFGLVSMLNFFDQRFRDVEEVEDMVGFNVLGTIPYIKAKQEMEMINSKKHPKDPIVEAYRSLRTNVKFLDKEKSIKTIMLTSNDANEGKSLTAINLASVMSDSGDRVVLIDADLRKPSLHKFFKKDRIPGLVELLAGKVKLRSVIKRVKDNLYLIPAGELVYNPQSVLESKQFDKFLELISQWADYVVIDTIPILSMSDAAILSIKVDGAILVVDSKKSTKRDTLLSKQKFLRLKSRVLGIVLNKNMRNYRKYNVYYYKKYT